MKKSLIIKLLVILVVAIISYCIFWFFKAGQSEKQISKLLSETPNFASVGELQVSGFPLKQNISIKNVKLSFNTSIFNDHKILIPEVQITAGIFSNEFSVKTFGAIKVEDSSNPSKLYDVQFNSEPKISIGIESGVISKFSYSDSGYQVSDESKKLFSSSSTTFNAILPSDQQGKISIKVTGKINEIEGYETTDLYQNLFEKKIVDAIKNDSIKVQIPEGFNSSESRRIFIEYKKSEHERSQIKPSEPNLTNQSAGNAPTSSTNATTTAVSAPQNTKQEPNTVNTVVTNQNPQQPTENNTGSATTNSTNETVKVSSIKSDLNFDFEIDLSSDNNSINIAQAPESSPRSSSVKINKLDFTNSLYEINVNGTLTRAIDDSTPFGGLSVKITNLDNLLKNFNENSDKAIIRAEKYSEISKPKPDYLDVQQNPVATTPDNNLQQAKTNNPENKKSPENKVSAKEISKNTNQKQAPNSPQNPASPNAIANVVDKTATNSLPQNYNMSDYYTYFFLNFTSKYYSIINETAFKNSVTKDNIAQFDIRREKNLEFFVNEIPLREILGKL